MAGLAARCTACGTAFRVVPDQLRVAGGYVRRGRCSAVFNAAESLIDLDSLAASPPAPATPQGVAPPAEVAPLDPVAASLEPPLEPPAERAAASETPAAVAAEVPAEAASEAAADLAAWPLPSEMSTAMDTAAFAPLEALDAPAAPAAPAPEPDFEPAPEAEQAPQSAPEATPEPDPEPDFTAPLAPSPLEPASVPDLADLPAFAEAEAEADVADAEPLAATNDEPAAEPITSGTDFDLTFVDPPPADEPEAPPQDLPADAADAFELDLPHPDAAAEPDASDEDAAAETATGVAAGDADLPEPAWAATALEAAPAADGDEDRPPRIDYNPQAAAEPVSIELTLPPPTPDAPPQQLSLQTAPAEEDLALRAEPSDQPSFVRRAERSQRWNAPPMRRRVAVGAVLGLVLLAGQAVFTWRNDIVARWPGTRPVIEPPCVAFGCSIEAPRALDALAIESSGLVRVEKSAVYKLQLALRNRSAQDVAVPALELTLSDAQGKPLARRVMRAADFGVNAATLPAGREVAMQATLQARFPGDVPVAGYTIDPFYP